MIHWKPRLAVLLLLVLTAAVVDGGIFWEFAKAAGHHH
jgi:hypothetical protein